MLTDLAAGRIDALAGTAFIPQRRAALEFSRPVALTGGAWFAAEGGNWPDDQALLAERSPPWRVITPATGPLFELIGQHFPLLSVLSCEDYASALQGVLDGRADAAALNWQVGNRLCDKDYPALIRHADAAFVNVPLVIATPVGDPQHILPRLNTHIPHSWGVDSDN